MKLRPGDVDEQHKSQPLFDKAGARPRRHLAALAASIAAHVAIAGVLILCTSPLARTHREWVLAYLVVVGDGASGRGGASAAAPGASSSRRDLATARPAAREARRHRARPATEVASRPPLRVVAARSAAPLAPASGVDTAAAGLAAAVDTDSGSRSATAPPGGGTAELAVADGAGNSIGNRNSIAHADYDTNPPPTYPALARRREQQGTVTLRVLVEADGSVSRAEIAESSGFDLLDAAALDTVRSRWRFVAARHDGFAVESWVLVPIRFALVEANANR